MSLLDEHLRTDDIDEAEAFIRRVYPRARVLDSRRPFAFEQRVVGDDRVNFARFAMSSRTEVGVNFDGVLGVGQLLSGQYRAVSNGAEVDVGAPFLLGPGDARSWSEGLSLLMVNIDEQALARFAGASAEDGRGRLRIPATGPTGPAASALWQRTARYVQEMFTAPELRENELIRVAAVDMLLAAALSAFPIEPVSVPQGGAGDLALPRAVRRALAYIEDNAGTPVVLEDVALAARMSVRGLQSAFQRHLGTTPMAALRSTRLTGAHTDLLAADPRGTTVAIVARRWGWAHLSRFSAEYRARYGELPSETLRR